MVILRLGVGEEGAELVARVGDGHGGEEAGGNKIKQRRLRGVESHHDDNSHNETEDVASPHRPEVPLANNFALCTASKVPAQKQGDEQRWDDNISESQHGEALVWGGVEVPREDKLDRGVERLRDGDHNWGAKHPENVVEKEPTQHDCAIEVGTNVNHLNALDRKRNSENVVAQPVSGHTVNHGEHGAKHGANRLSGVKLELFKDREGDFKLLRIAERPREVRPDDGPHQPS
mmetsp:Transcript_45377/g.98238  ORF Transcript_45377/g.98238 Transcript_45377/m.98238 type:complete len:232 (+) Transcript_45377:295-990(+)